MIDASAVMKTARTRLSAWTAPVVLALVVGLLAPAAQAADASEPGASAREAGAVTLGLRRHSPPYGRGWGRVEPRVIYNGGVPSGLARRLEWTRWGSPSAFAVGRTAAYRPEGGYYSRSVRIEMKATRLRTCRGHGAYTVLKFRAQRRPEGPMPQRWSTWTTGMCQPWEYA